MRIGWPFIPRRGGFVKSGDIALHAMEVKMYERFIASLPSAQQGKAGYILLWLLGVPIPVLFLIFLLRGCS